GLGAVPLRVDGGVRELLALGQRRQLGRLVAAVAGVVAAVAVDGLPAWEGDRAPGGGPLGLHAVGGRGADPGGDRVAAGVGHLGGEGALPDELVEPELVPAQLAPELVGAAPRVAGGPDRLVGLLGVLRLLGVGAGRVG